MSILIDNIVGQTSSAVPLLNRSFPLLPTPHHKILSLTQLAHNRVKSDLSGNIKKIRDRQLAAPAASETLQDLVRNELKEKKHTATEGLVWLVR